MLILTLIILTLLTVIYYFFKEKYRYWQKRQIKGPKPIWFVGNLGKSFIMKASPGDIYAEIYSKYQDEEVVGIYRVTTPMLLIRDPELIKEVTVKSFSHFRDNDIDVDKKTDSLFGRHPFVLKGDEWKMVRAQITPGFSSGKMKWLYPLLEDTAINMIKFLDGLPEATNGQGYEAKELCVRYTLNNVASCAFGLEGKCFQEENSEFRQLAKDFFTPGSFFIIYLFFKTICPSLIGILPINFANKPVEDKLIDIVTQTLKYRQENSIVRNDYLQILSQLKKTCKDYEFTDVDVTAHAAGFFGDGYETSSGVMSFVLYQLGLNPDAQEKLRAEVEKVYQENDNSLPYESLQELTYLDAVVNETLRIQSVAQSLQKICTETFSYKLRNNTTITIEKGTPIILSLTGLHLDPKYHKDPQSFKPERFIGENKDTITKYTFLPFGEGPRACLGQRFGLLQIKVGIAYIILNYQLSINKKTQHPLKYDPTYILLTAVGGLWLDFKNIR